MGRTFLITVNRRYDGQTLAVCICEFLEILSLWEGFIVRKLIKMKSNPQYKNIYVIALCVSMFIACIGYVSFLHSVIADIGDNEPPPALACYNEDLL
jgi:hypothetical protein